MSVSRFSHVIIIKHFLVLIEISVFQEEEEEEG